ncbi:T9SS type A sorting domain-containing protein [bacterium]|nr:T9SS type A sorting domain-containing protein [bacterium]
MIDVPHNTEGGEFFDEDDVYVWPNPAGERATFTVGGNSIVKLVVYDLAGREVHRDSGEFLTGDVSEFVWDLACVASDVYVFHIHAEETSGQLRRAAVMKRLAVVR